jgi:hypothetical protein
MVVVVVLENMVVCGWVAEEKLMVDPIMSMARVRTTAA